LEKIAESLEPQLRQDAEAFRCELEDQCGRVFGVQAE
jgi:hypothetical protein